MFLAIFNAIKDKKTAFVLLLWAMLVALMLIIPFFSLTISKKIELDWLGFSGKKSAIVFFGFQGCGDICPMTLYKLSQLINSFEEEADIPSVLFVDIESTSNSESADKYAKNFNFNFHGIHVSNKDLTHLSEQFGLNINEKNGLINHIGKTYLLKNTGDEWRLVKAFPPKSVSVISLRESIDAL